MQILAARRECLQLLNDGCRHRDAQLLRGHLGNHVILAAMARELLSALLLEVAHQRVHLHAHTGLRLPSCLHADQSWHANGSQGRELRVVASKGRGAAQFPGQGLLVVLCLPLWCNRYLQVTALQPLLQGCRWISLMCHWSGWVLTMPPMPEGLPCPCCCMLQHRSMICQYSQSQDTEGCPYKNQVTLHDGKLNS